MCIAKLGIQLERTCRRDARAPIGDGAVHFSGLAQLAVRRRDADVRQGEVAVQLDRLLEQVDGAPHRFRSVLHERVASLLVERVRRQVLRRLAFDARRLRGRDECDKRGRAGWD